MPGSDQDHDRFHTLNSQFDGKSKTAHIAPQTIGQMVAVNEIIGDEITATTSITTPAISDLQTASIQTITDLEEIDSDIRFVGAGSSLQTAITEVAVQGWVIIKPDFDLSNDTLPITISEPIRLSGTGFHDIIAPDNSSNVLEVNLGGANAPPGPTIENLGIQNGLRGVSVADARYVKLDHVHVEDADFGIDIEQGPTANSVSCTLVNCQLDGNVNAGLDTDPGAHGLRVLGCLIQNNGARGIDIDTSSSVSVAHSTIQLNGNVGIGVGTATACTIEGCYLEDNDSSNTRDIIIDGGTGTVVEGCYFQGLNNNSTAVTVTSASTTTSVRQCDFVDYTASAINIVGGDDHSVDEHTHTVSGVPLFVDDDGNRTRDAGHVRVGGTAAVGKVFGGMVNAAHHDFGSVQAAIDYGAANGAGIIVVPTGTFGAISIPSGLRVMGVSQIGASSTTFSESVSDGGTVDLGGGATIQNAAVENTGTGSGDHGIVASSNSTTIDNVRVQQTGGDGMNVSANNVSILQCTSGATGISGDPLELTSSSEQCIATNNRGFLPIVDNGTGNVVMNNT